MPDVLIRTALPSSFHFTSAFKLSAMNLTGTNVLEFLIFAGTSNSTGSLLIYAVLSSIFKDMVVLSFLAIAVLFVSSHSTSVQELQILLSSAQGFLSFL